MTGRPVHDGELTALDADGQMLREWDGVVLIRPLPATGQGNCAAAPDVIPAGTRATAIALLDPATGTFDLECYLDPSGETYAFARARGAASAARAMTAALI